MMQPLVQTTECTLLFQPFCPAGGGDCTAVLLALKAGHLVARLVDEGKWTLPANTKRHQVRRGTHKARQRASPGDGTLIIRPSCPLSEEKGEVHFLRAWSSQIKDGQRCCCLTYQCLPGELPGLEMKLPHVKSTRDISLVMCPLYA